MRLRSLPSRALGEGMTLKGSTLTEAKAAREAYRRTGRFICAGIFIGFGYVLAVWINDNRLEKAIEARESCLTLARAQDTHIDELRETIGHMKAVIESNQE